MIKKRKTENLCIYLIILLLLSPIKSMGIGEEESLMDIKEGEAFNFSFGEEKKSEKKPKPTVRRVIRRGNLPSTLVRENLSQASSKRKDPVQFPELSPVNRSGMEVGDIFDCMISQDIKAYVGSVSPIKAEVLTGEKKGTIFVGNATMDPKTKDIVVEFNLARNFESRLKHKLKATLHSQSGQLGLKGTFHSKYWQYFFATVISRGAQGYAEATVERNRNVFGTYQEIPNPENAGKTAVAEAASGTTDLIADEMRNLPEFVTKKGPIRTKIFITETPKLLN